MKDKRYVVEMHIRIMVKDDNTARYKAHKLAKKIADNWIKTHLEGRSLTCTLTCGKRQTNAADKSNLIRSQVNLT